MPEALADALQEIRSLLLGRDLVRAVAGGRRRGRTPTVTRAQLRPVQLRGGARLQVVTTDGRQPTTRNLPPGPETTRAVDALLEEPFGTWRVENGHVTLQLRVTKSGTAQVHRGPGTDGQGHTDGQGGTDRQSGVPPARAGAHDRSRRHLLDPGDPLFSTLQADAAKRRQVDAFLRALAATLPQDPARLPDPLHLVDLGCGNAYLTFAVYRWLTAARGLTVHVTGVDVRDDQRARNSALADELGYADGVRFVAGTIGDAAVAPAPHLVLALHACDTATDEALARAVGWQARWVLAAPCCHHDLAAQLRGSAATPAGYRPLLRHGILRERYAEVLTDALRAALLRRSGYRVAVQEFVDAQHTPRNVLLRATRTGATPGEAQRREYDALVAEWPVTPYLARLLG